MTSSLGWSLSFGKSEESTIAKDATVKTKGQVASGCLRWKTTVLSSGASTLFMFASRDEAPFGSAISMLRSNEHLTSSAVISSPSENLSPSFIVHSYVVGLVYSHFSAASGTGLFSPGGMVMRFW